MTEDKAAGTVPICSSTEAKLPTLRKLSARCGASSLTEASTPEVAADFLAESAHEAADAAALFSTEEIAAPSTETAGRKISPPTSSTAWNRSRS